MKTLVLVRHAKSSWDDPSLPDHDRPLNARGMRDAPRMAAFFSQQQLPVDLIVSSTARRAADTALAFARAIQYPASQLGWHRQLYLASAEELLSFVQQLDDRYQRVMLVGHNDGISHFANGLLGDKQIDSLPTTAVLAIDLPAATWSQLSWHQGAVRFYFYPKMPLLR